MGTFIINHPDFGWQAFGGNLLSTSPTVKVQTRDSVRRRVYIAPLGSMLTLDAGSFSVVEFDPQSKAVTLTVTAIPDGAVGAAPATSGRLTIQQKATLAGVGSLKTPPALEEDAGAFVIPFTNGQAQVDLFVG